jgi:hypothetical protein
MEKGISHADYNIIFSAGVVDDMPVERVRLTELYVPTGRIVVTDPLVVPDLLPLARGVSPGTYPVDLYIAATPASGPRIAVATLTFGESVATKYELALRGRENITELKEEGDYFGFPVDSGLGAFYDAETSKLYNGFIERFYAEDPAKNIYDHYLAPLFKANARRPDDVNDPGDWLDFHLPNSSRHNVAMFQSGYGDGVYPAYWGVDSSGNAVNLVIDFHVLLLPD